MGTVEGGDGRKHARTVSSARLKEKSIHEAGTRPGPGTQGSLVQAVRGLTLPFLRDLKKAAILLATNTAVHGRNPRTGGYDSSHCRVRRSCGPMSDAAQFCEAWDDPGLGVAPAQAPRAAKKGPTPCASGCSEFIFFFLSAIVSVK